MYNDFIQRIVEMKAKGIGSRSIARELGISKSSVNYFYKRFLNEAGVAHAQGQETPDWYPDDFPKVLFLDIETAPVMAFVWRLFKENIGLNQIAADWHLLSYSAKWLGYNDTIYRDQRDKVDITDDTDLLVEIWELLDEADIVVTQNGKRFDLPKIKARMVIHKFKPFSPFRHIDTWQIAKKTMGFTSNKLEYMSDALCPDLAKSKHKKFPGFELWAECMKGNIEAWIEMEEYNRQDVIALEGVYHELAPWCDRLPNFAAYTTGNEFVCHCGSTDVVEDGFAYTDVSKFKRYRCSCCGKSFRGRKSVLTKDKRAGLLTNIREN